MTWFPKFALFAACVAAISVPTKANDPILPDTLPVQLDPAGPDNVTLGELTYLGGLEIEPGEDEIGGITGLEWHDGQLYAVTSDGNWLVVTTDELRGQLLDLIEIETGKLLDGDGKKFRAKDGFSPDGLAENSDGKWVVSSGKDGPVLTYFALNDAATTIAAPMSRQHLLSRGHDAPPSPAPLDEAGGEITGVDCASNDVCYVLYRGHTAAHGFRAAIVAIGPDGLHETIASWVGGLTIDNFEGIAVREEDGRTFLYIVSDNNFSDDQRTLLMKFEVSERAANLPGVPPKVYETVSVVIETTMGEITIALETERAPITAANFLRYVDENRYDNTKCYRAMKVEGGEQPAGFLQCGTQNRPDLVLPGIAHEPTSETGLSHTNGALSMARFEPGTATGDFSIMIRDQRGLDAYLESDDADRRAGFAVFAYVTGGMDVVHAIHATETDPDKGEGFLKGQMLADPIKIIDMRRVEPVANAN